jgi:hypothetical protein
LWEKKQTLFLLDLMPVSIFFAITCVTRESAEMIQMKLAESKSSPLLLLFYAVIDVDVRQFRKHSIILFILDDG